MLDYFRDNRENIYTVNDVDENDSVILFKDEAGANWYDRIIPIKLLIDWFGGANKFGHRHDWEVQNEGDTTFTISFEPSDIAMVFVAGQLKSPLEYTIIDNIITFNYGLKTFDKVTIIG